MIQIKTFTEITNRILNTDLYKLVCSMYTFDSIFKLHVYIRCMPGYYYLKIL